MVNLQDALEALREEVADMKSPHPTGASLGKAAVKASAQLHSLAVCRACKTTPIYGNLYRCLFCKV